MKPKAGGEVQLHCWPFPAVEGSWQDCALELALSVCQGTTTKVRFTEGSWGWITEHGATWGGQGQLKRDNNFVRREMKLLVESIPWSIFFVLGQFKNHVCVQHRLWMYVCVCEPVYSTARIHSSPLGKWSDNFYKTNIARTFCHGLSETISTSNTLGQNIFFELVNRIYGLNV